MIFPGPDTFTRFVIEHENDDTSRLLLSRDKWKGIDIDLAVNTILSRKKLRDKVPAWYAATGLVYPAKLSAEQCSSQGTAFYKACIASRLLSCAPPMPQGNGQAAHTANESSTARLHIADMTGGLGVDSWAFSKVTGADMLYNEMNQDLADAAGHNFRILGVENIRISCAALTPDSADLLLEDFRPDLIFLDPARRDDTGKKVFMIEDCRPDVLALEDRLLELSRFLMVKLSPMADISMVAGKLGEHCREIHVISSGGECKELLVVLDREFKDECMIIACCDADKAVSAMQNGIPLESAPGIFTFLRSEERSAAASFIAPESAALPIRGLSSLLSPLPGTAPAIRTCSASAYLFEPGKSLMKAGAFNLISAREGIDKLSRSTHLYLFSDNRKISSLSAMGKVFRILDVLPFSGKGIRQAAKECPEAEVTARNVHMTSDTLRKKLGVKPSDKYHIFGAEYLFVTERIQSF